ncbi:MAG: DNA repair protein RadC [Rickettsiales bacterium]|nr:DNA repair protein RadC [Rickettsiales bacterium]
MKETPRTYSKSRCDELDRLICENRSGSYSDIREQRQACKSDLDSHHSRDSEHVLNHIGHRKRVREKFLTSLGKELHDYELLEILLFAANARLDTKPLSKKLIAKFGDISAVVNADVNLLKEVEGVSDSAITSIKIISEIINRVLKNSAKTKPVLNNWQAVLDYSYALLKNLNYEVFRVLFLDKRHRLIEDELLGIGENDYVVVSSKAIAKKALLLNASSIILLHNHPSGELKPSTADIKTTNEIILALKNLEIKILDHLIIGGSGYFSFKEEGLI